TFVAPPLPTVTGLGPSSGSILGTYTVVILGSGFTGATTVAIGGTAVYSFTVLSDTAINLSVPAHVAGTAHLTVTTPGGTSAASAADQFTFVATRPTVTALSPSSGSVLGGYTVVILGSGFTGTTTVSIGSTAVYSFTELSDTAISLSVPAHVAGTAHLTVKTPGGTSATTAADQFTFVATRPTVTALGLASGSTRGGDRGMIL